MPDPPPSLAAALLHHAAQGREEPWLFRAEGWDWRWHSWGEAARWMTAWAESLSRLPAASRAAFSYAPRPPAIFLDLAIQAAGLVPVPVSIPVSNPPDAGFWVEIEGEGLKVTELSDPQFISPKSLPNPFVDPIPSFDPIMMAKRVQAEIQEPPRKDSREIVILSGPLERPEERAMLSWATVVGAAVVLEPEPALRVATAAWVRPTVFHGTAAEIAGLRQWVEKEGKGFWRRGPGLPFRRLRTVLAVDDLPEEEEAFWRGRGVQVGRLLIP
jgi:hypothetical protein